MLFNDITIVGENYDVQEHMYLLTEDTKITYIGTTPPVSYDGEIYDGKDKVIMPAFFNTHCHVPMTILRGYGEGLSLHDWLFTKMFPFEALLTDDDCYWGTLLGACELIASGVCSITDMYMFTKGTISGIATSGLKANLSCTPTSGLDHNPPIHDMDILLDFMKTRDNDRIKADIAIHAEYTTSEENILNASKIAKELKANIHLHLSETESEHNNCKESHNGMTPTEYFDSLGVFQNKTTAAHCIWIEENDMDILAKNNVTIAHCPTSNLKLGSGIAPITTFIKKGINVAIGTDGAASNNNLNMLEEVNLAGLLQKGLTKNPQALSTKEIMTLACKNGAISQGRTDCGEIKVGNCADIIVYDLNRPHLQPIYDVLYNILFSANASDIVLNMVDGKILYKEGTFTTIDVNQVIENVKRIREEKLAELS